MDDQKKNERLDPALNSAEMYDTDELAVKLRAGCPVSKQEIMGCCPAGYMISHETNGNHWTVAGWHYADDMRGERIFVIDEYGRLRAPSRTFETKKEFLAETAVFEAWNDPEEECLILSWALKSPNEGHQCGVLKRPDELSTAQKDRVRLIQKNLMKEWREKACEVATPDRISAINKGADWDLF